jgi:hypothetical protein
MNFMSILAEKKRAIACTRLSKDPEKRISSADVVTKITDSD